MPAGAVEMTEDDSVTYYERITATCTEKALFKTFGGWILDPPVEDVDLRCIPNGFCNFKRNKSPIPVMEDDVKVAFAPFNNFLSEPLTTFQAVEIGGHILVYCKGMGNK